MKKPLTPEQKQKKVERNRLYRARAAGFSTYEEYVAAKKDIYKMATEKRLKQLVLSKGFADYSEYLAHRKECIKKSKREYTARYKIRKKQEKLETLGMTEEQYKEHIAEKKREYIKKAISTRIEQHIKYETTTPPYISAGITKEQYRHWIESIKKLQDKKTQKGRENEKTYCTLLFA